MSKLLVLCMLATAAYAGYPFYAAPAVKVVHAPLYSYQPKPVVAVPKPVEVEKPEPYDFSYETKDEDGNTQARQESGDGTGAVSGSYSYTDANGLFRRVNYVADAEGFKSSIETNEPGTANANPADVEVTAQEAPAIQVKAAPVHKVVKLVHAPYYHAPLAYGYGHA
ncbi:cuticle protein 10.9-like [Limulus polyphemus]|uniref:Cuticle protein 10.9-like n=1 Tax=Limulus polyphemus TaxID=6850 RepID=A0ABM1BIQ4_LIMPO|nr:cuticle protein 10.9-like [Limulus polyphemus]